jgi:hypothetical protein
MSRWRAVLVKYVAGALAVLLPAAPLSSTKFVFYADWSSHLWLVGYFGEHLRRHGEMPVTLHTTTHLGLAFPVFYGPVFYKSLGVLAAVVNAHLALRLAAAAMLLAQYVGVRKTLRRLGACEGLAASAACLVVWATYALTNLYNRAALTEFFAVGCLTCAVCAWFDFLAARRRGRAAAAAARFGLWLTLAAGSHPITALLSAPVLAVLALFLAPAPVGPGRLPRLAALAAAAALSGLVLAPWLYACRTVGGDLWVRDTCAKVIYFPDSLDSTANRLGLLPRDPRTERDVPLGVSTPYLDAQVNLALVGLLAFALATNLRRFRGAAGLRAAPLLAAPLALGLAALAVSLRPWTFDYLPRLFRSVQFAYRLVSYVNLSALVALLALFYLRRRGGPAPAGERPASPAFLAAVLGLAAAGLLLKLQHGREVRAEHHLPRSRSDPQYAVWLSSFGLHSASDYMSTNWLARLSPAEEQAARRVELPLGPADFGRPQPLTVSMGRAGYVVTRALPFRWAELRVDGEPVPAGALRLWSSAPPGEPRSPWVRREEWIAVPVPAGEHVLEYRFRPGRAWGLLNRVSNVALLGWVAGLLGVAGWRAAARLRRRAGAVVRRPAPAPAIRVAGAAFGRPAPAAQAA